MEKKEGREGTLGEMENEGIEREGQGQFPESHKAKPEPLAKTNKKIGLYPYWYAQAGTIG